MINKFRAWDTRNNEMVFSENTDCFYINTKGVLFMYAIPRSESGLETIYHKSYDVDRFTGLTDECFTGKGKDIYEGDIVNIYGTGNCVVSITPQLGVCFTEIADKFSVECAHDVMMENDLGELIGNIHSNPELLEQ